MTLPSYAQPASSMFSMANWGLNDPLKEAMAPVSLNPYMAGGNQMVNGIAAPGPAAVAPAFGSSPLTINPDSIFPNGVDGNPRILGAAPAAGSGGGMFGGLFDGFLGSEKDGVKTQGWGGLAVGAASGLLNSYMGMKQYGMAKDNLAESKRQYDSNYAAQKTTTNASLEDRQRARVASNDGAYQSVGDYMNKNGIK